MGRAAGRKTADVTVFMNRRRTFAGRRSLVLVALLGLAGCASGYGTLTPSISQPGIAAAYLPLRAKVHLGIDTAVGAAMVIRPGIAVTNAHNANLLDSRLVIGKAGQSDLLFFRSKDAPAPATASPVVGQAVTAYGQGTDGKLRFAHGAVRQIVKVQGYDASPYFIFTADAGPGYSGGPVIDASGKLIGITFGYKDQGSERLMYAYDMTRVMAELSLLEKRRPQS